MQSKNMFFISAALSAVSIFSTINVSYALPAFGEREHVSCIICHSNGSAPHLTKTGYLYRRAGFRFPTDIGNLEKDKEAMTIINHLAAGVSVDYLTATSKPRGQSESRVNNEINVGEVEIWPLVGSFFGHYAVWSELDMSPSTAAPRDTPTPPNITTPANGGIELSQADLRYASGNPNLFFNMRVGLIAPEGFGASDQWIDDGNIPLFETLSPQFNQDTLVLPLGALQNPQMGAEFGLNYFDSHLTLGILNGFDGTNGFANKIQSTATPQLLNPDSKGSKDYKVQLDQFIGENWEATGVYYNGRASLLDPTNVIVWQDKFTLWRLYLTYMIAPNVVDILAGGARGTNDYVQPASNVIAGQFKNRGAFVGANYYVMPHLTLSGRLDYFKYAYGVPNANQNAKGLALMASLPYENNIYVLHFNKTDSDITGISKDFRVEWRLLF